MNSKLIYALVLLFILFSIQCRKPDPDVNPGTIHNMSQRTITASLSNYKTIDPVYPDTVLPIERTTTGGPVLPDKETFIFIRNVSWEMIFNNLDRDTMSFYIYDVDTLAKYPWETIRERYMILQRYDLSIHDLRKLEYIVYYPPTPTMANMKMWPSYGVSK